MQQLNTLEALVSSREDDFSKVKTTLDAVRKEIPKSNLTTSLDGVLRKYQFFFENFRVIKENVRSSNIPYNKK